jgi:CRP-like cAMP-binding protein
VDREVGDPERYWRNPVKLTKSFLEQNVESLDAGALVFKEGEIGEKMYIILAGEIDIRKSTAEKII